MSYSLNGYGGYGGGTVTSDSVFVTSFKGSDPWLGLDLVPYYRVTTKTSCCSEDGICGKISLLKIKDIKVIVSNKVVEVTFNNGHKQKAVCAEEDTFSLEQAITICWCKEVIGGTKEYNSMVRDAIRKYDKKLEDAKKQELAKEQAKKRKDKYLAYKKKKADKKREAEIELQTEAYLRAMKAMKEIMDVEWKDGLSEDGESFTIKIPVMTVDEDEPTEEDGTDSQE